jgi:hypothetical protein
MRFRSRGLTMIEATIVGVILVMVILMVMGILYTMDKETNRGTATSEAETRGRILVDLIKEELFYAKLDYTDSTNNKPEHYKLKYQIANKTGTISYGYTDAQGTFQSGWSCLLEFVPEHVYLEATAVNPLTSLPWTRYTIPLNLNSSTAEALVRGRMMKKVYNGNTLVYQLKLCDDVIMNAADLMDGDVNGDGTEDPLFTLQDATGAQTILAPAQVRLVNVNVWVGLFDFDHTRFFLRNCIQQVKFKNPQS